MDTQAQQRLKSLYDVRLAIYRKLSAYAADIEAIPESPVGKEISEIFAAANIPDIGNTFLKNKNLKFAEKYFLKFYPEKEAATKDRKEFYKAQVEVEGLGNKAPDIVVFDENNKPVKYQSEDAFEEIVLICRC